MRVKWLGALLLWCAACAGAVGAGPKKVEIVNVDLGWGGVLPAEKWAPATVQITSHGKAFTGQLVVEYSQDATQKAQIVVAPVSTTPGVTTPVEIELAVPEGCDKITFTLSDGWSQDSVTFSQRGGDDLPMPRRGAGESGLVVFVGNTSAAKAVELTTSIERLQRNRQEDSGESSVEKTWNALSAGTIAPSGLPKAWTAYQSVDVLVVDADVLNSADPRARAAVMQWVQSGGRLVLRVDDAGSVWRRLLPAGEMGDGAEAAEQKPLEAPEELRKLVTQADRASLPGRVLTLTPGGMARGWKVMYGTGPGSGLVAYGPVGLGMVSLVGFAPERAAGLSGDSGARAVWRDVMWPVMPPGVVRANLNAPQVYWRGGFTTDTVHTNAVNTALDEVAVVPPIGSGTFWAIAACMMVLALMLGPGDAKILKRMKMSQRSWMTALVWIGAASAAAVLVPRVMRSGQTVVSRLVVRDTVCDGDGVALRTAHVGVMGMFAGRPEDVQIGGQCEGAWLRGVAAQSRRYGGEALGAMGGMTTQVRAEQSEEPMQTAWAEEVRVPQWAFRTLMDMSPLVEAPADEVGAKVTRTADGYRVEIRNMPAKAAGVAAVLRTVEGAVDLKQEKPGVFVGSVHSASPVDPELQTTATVLSTGWSWSDSMPWTLERDAALKCMVESGRYVCVEMRCTGMPMDLSLGGVRRLSSSRTGIYRMLTPVEKVP